MGGLGSPLEGATATAHYNVLGYPSPAVRPYSLLIIVVEERRKDFSFMDGCYMMAIMNLSLELGTSRDAFVHYLEDRSKGKLP